MGVYWHALAVILHDFLQPTSAEIHRCKFINFNSIIEHEEYCVITHHRWMKYTSNMECRNCVMKRHFILIMAILCHYMVILCHYMVILCHYMMILCHHIIWVHLRHTSNDLHVHVPLIIDLSGSRSYSVHYTSCDAPLNVLPLVIYLYTYTGDYLIVMMYC